MAQNVTDILQFKSIKSTGIGLLDGGLATHLEDVLNQAEISNSSLWSAALLFSKSGSNAIRQAHIDFLNAGAQIISTCTYQASQLAFSLAGKNVQEFKVASLLAIDLATEARDQFLKANPSVERPLISLSLGPFGAALSNGSEYTGHYVLNGKSTNEKDLQLFHFERLKVIASSSIHWQQIDLLAFETIPRQDEVKAIRRALKQLYNEDSIVKKLSYASFVFPNGSMNQNLQDLVTCVFNKDEENLPSFNGIGVNCTNPKFIQSIVKQLSHAVKSLSCRDVYLFIYPDGGLVWEAKERKWNQASQNLKQSDNWSDDVFFAVQNGICGDQKELDFQVKKAILIDKTWSGCFVGGCCKATVDDIRALKSRINRGENVLS